MTVGDDVLDRSERPVLCEDAVAHLWDGVNPESMLGCELRVHRRIVGMALDESSGACTRPLRILCGFAHEPGGRSSSRILIACDRVR